MIRVITENGKKKIAICVDTNLHEAYISKSGKSLVYRVMGTYLKYNGEIIGEQGKIGGYISQGLGMTVETENKNVFTNKDVVDYDFGDDLIRKALIIPVTKIIQ